MSSHYPFERLWHHSRGIKFAPSKSDPQVVYPKLDLTRYAHTQATTASSNPETPQLINAMQAEKSEEESCSFSTAPEYEDTMDTEMEDLLPTTEAPPAVAAIFDPSQENLSPEGRPLTKLEYNMTEEAYNTARAAAEDTPASFWSYSQYRGPAGDDGESKAVKVHYCKSKHTTERACQYFLGEKVIGFDLEWQPNATRTGGPRRNCALIQIASPSRIALFHVALYPKKSEGEEDPEDLVAPTLRRILEDPEVSKVGVNIKGDCTRMRNFLGIGVRGIFELSHLYKLVKYSSSGRVYLINKKVVALAKQVQECLGLPLFKGSDVRSSDWDQDLNMDQIVYSASDAYAGLQLYHVLNERRQTLDPMPPLPWHAELDQPIELAPGVVKLKPADDPAAASQNIVDAENKEPYSVNTPRRRNAAPASRTQRSGSSPVSGTPSTADRLNDTRIKTGEARAAQHKASRSYIRAQYTCIRTYYIWYDNDGLRPEEIAKMLRDPPLQLNTVVGYILEAIKQERLPFDEKRLRNEVLHHWSREVLKLRYPVIYKQAYES